MERLDSYQPSLSSSSASYSSSSTAASRRNSFSLLEKPSDAAPGLSSFSSFTSLHGLASSASSSRVALIPMPVVRSANSALGAFRASIRWLSSSRPELPSYVPLANFAPPFQSPAPPHRLRVFSNCTYRRAILWAVGAVCALLIVFLTLGRPYPPSTEPSPEESPVTSSEAVWLDYEVLNGYFNGLRSIVSMEHYQPEFPTQEDSKLARKQALNAMVDESTKEVHGTKTEKRVDSDGVSATAVPVPTPSIYKPQPDYNSTDYLAKFYPVQRCYLDAAKTLPVPDIWAYSGVPQGQPGPMIGSHSLVGLRDDICFDRFGRYGPYGLGYSKEEGGTGLALDTEMEGSETIWSTPSTSGKINYNDINWAETQKRCFEANKDRFQSGDNIPKSSEYSHLTSEMRMIPRGDNKDGSITSTTTVNGLQKIERTAIVMRCYAGFKWTLHSILNLRALVSEMALQSGGEYDVHILLHARDENIAVWADEETANEFIADNIPHEFRDLVTLWSEGQMRLLYPGLQDRPTFHNPSNADIHGVYRSAHLPLQHFAQQHPEYAYYWNWEMDMRFLGSYYEFFDRLSSWADKQPRRRLWERSAKFYIPALHGSWENFTALVDAEAHEAGRPSILGELNFTGRSQTRDEEKGVSPLPEGCGGAVLSTSNRTAPPEVAGLPGRHFFADINNNYTNIPELCGVNEPADLITLNPIFDAEDSGWFFSDDVTGYDLAFAAPPRRTAIITASRLSRRLLFAMHEETWRLHHGMFSEMFPPSVALHRGFKAVYAPHPVFADRRWPLVAAEKAFNGGPDHSSGASPQSPYLPANEHFFRGLSWYYNSDFGGRLWRRWLGYPQPLDDPQIPPPESTDAFAGFGGGSGQEGFGTTGRMCMRSMLVHPIKYEMLDELFG